MDRLARNAMLAKQAGMSYGKWKAMQPIVEVKEKPMPEGYRKCEYCGEPFPKKQGKRFCHDECRREAYRPRENAIQREYQRRRIARLKEGANNAG
jgi:hypothetical protein